MHDPLREAIRHRRTQGLDLDSILHPAPDGALDDAKLSGTGGKLEPQKDPDESKGDLAPEGEAQHDSLGEPGAHLAEHGDQNPAQRKAIHASEDQKLKGSLEHHEMGNPEHEPLSRGNGQDQFGHEASGQDQEFESLMSQGHEQDDPRRPPRTLGARVRQALSSKKMGRS